MVEKTKCSGADAEACLLCAAAPSPSRQASIPVRSLFPGMMSVPCRAELFWSESDRLLGPFSAAGAAGPDVTAAEAHREPMRAQEEEAPRERKASSIGVRARRREERGGEASDMVYETVSGEAGPCSCQDHK